jgi:D-3-phosphoglycerate dehydrogenase
MTTHILLLEDIHAAATPILQELPDARIRRLQHAPSSAELIALLADVQVLGLRSRTALTREVLAQAPQLRAVGAYCTGTNNIDLPAASELGIAVFNGPFSNTRSVAELVISHAIALLRRVPERNAAAHRGVWLKDAQGANEVRGKTLGIVGYGKVGTQAGLLAEAIGMRVVYFDIEARLPLGNAMPCASLQALLEQSDVVSLHVPQTPQTQLLMNAGTLAQMKDGAVLLNLARGDAVDIEALAQALAGPRLRGAALDVFPREPASAQEAFTSVLRNLDKVLLTPHIGGSTVEAQRNLGVEVSEKLRDYLRLGAIRGSVNLPELPLGPLRAPARVLHLHQDRPGVMAQVSSVLGAAGLNVSQLHLETLGGFGVAAVDVSAPLDDATLELLRHIAGTTRVTRLTAVAAASVGEAQGAKTGPAFVAEQTPGARTFMVQAELPKPAAQVAGTRPANARKAIPMNYEERDSYGMYETRSPSGPGPALMGANTLLGNDVCNLQEESLGEIKEIMLDMRTGRISYAVLSFGGFLGMGEKLFAVPWSALTLDTVNKRFTLNVTLARLEEAPGFDKDSWPDMADPAWVQGVHAYYGIQPWVGDLPT